MLYSNVPANTNGSYKNMGGYWICYNYESISFVNFYYKSGSLGNGSAYAKSWDNGEKLGRYYINNNHVYHDCVSIATVPQDTARLFLHL